MQLHATPKTQNAIEEKQRIRRMSLELEEQLSKRLAVETPDDDAAAEQQQQGHGGGAQEG